MFTSVYIEFIYLKLSAIYIIFCYLPNAIRQLVFFLQNLYGQTKRLTEKSDTQENLKSNQLLVATYSMEYLYLIRSGVPNKIYAFYLHKSLKMQYNL